MDRRPKIPRRGRIEVGLGLHCHGGRSDGLFFISWACDPRGRLCSGTERPCQGRRVEDTGRR